VLDSGIWAALVLAALRPDLLAAGWGADAASLLALLGLPRGLLPGAALVLGTGAAPGALVLGTGAVAGTLWLLVAWDAASSGWWSLRMAALASALLALVGLPLAFLAHWVDVPPGGAVGAVDPRPGSGAPLAGSPPGARP
jgi:hypothetical protein